MSESSLISFSEFDSALTLEELRLGKVSTGTATPPPFAPAPAPPAPAPYKTLSSNEFLADSPKTSAELIPASPFEPAFDDITNLVELWYFLYPEVRIYKWQAEELYRISGFPTGSPKGGRFDWAPQAPYKCTYVCANGSGKDKVINSMTAVGLPLLYRNVYVVGTSSSYDQLKDQTESHILDAIGRLHDRTGKTIYHSVEFRHTCEERGAKIKLFATNDAKRTEGWHPIAADGRLVLIINEAKSIDPPIFAALDRCFGYSHWIEISSPGMRRGLFYNNWRRAQKYVEDKVAKPFRYFGRRVSYKECPHITEEMARVVWEKNLGDLFIPETSLNANFYEQETDIVIPVRLIEECARVDAIGDDIGIGLDAAAGGDETSLRVRRGNHIIKSRDEQTKNTRDAVYWINEELHEFKDVPYIFDADDGGISKGIVDGLTELGWIIRRRHNQSAAYNKRRFMNLGAEIWFHTRTLIERRQIVMPDVLENTHLQKLYDQLSTRVYKRQDIQGKIYLESKKKLKEAGAESPDRADAFVLCFFSFKSKEPTAPAPKESSGVISYDEFVKRCVDSPNFLETLFSKTLHQKDRGNYTILK